MINFNRLKESQQNYFQHTMRASSLSIVLIFLTFIAFIHAAVPFIFYDTASSWIKDLDKKINPSI